MSRRHRLGLVAAGLVGGAALGGSIMSASDGARAQVMDRVSLEDAAPDGGLINPRVIGLDGAQLTEHCRSLSLQFGMTPDKLVEAAFDLRVSAKMGVRNIIQDRLWRDKNWVERLRVTYLGPTQADVASAQREVLAMRGTLTNMLRVADILETCTGRIIS